MKNHELEPQPTKEVPKKIRDRMWLTKNGLSLPTVVVEPQGLLYTDLAEAYRCMNEEITTYDLPQHDGLVVRSVVPFSLKWATKMTCLQWKTQETWPSRTREYITTTDPTSWYMIHLDDASLQQRCLHARIGMDTKNGHYFVTCDRGSDHARILDNKQQDSYLDFSLYKIAYFLKSRYPILQTEKVIELTDFLAIQFPQSNQYELRIYPNGKIFVLGVY